MEEVKLPIGQEEIWRAATLLARYKEGKANLERKIVENEQWYKLRHWECMRTSRADEVRPVSGWLFNSIAGKHADAMDNIPSPTVLPREEGDAAEAELLSQLLPVILEQSDFEQVYSDVWDYKLKTGTGVYGVFFDPHAAHGLGEVRVRKVDVLNLFWEPGVQSIEQSQNLFHVSLVSNEELEARYPALVGTLGTPTVNVAQYVFDDKVDTSDKSAVVDWYYKKHVGGKTLLHYCKYVNDTLLFSSENDPERYENGWYEHGEYPFVFDTLYRAEGTPCGFGFIDVAKDAQSYIDRGNQALMKNLLAGAAPRYFVRESGGVNEEEFADLSRELIHVSGGVGEESIRPVESKPLPSVYLSLLHSKIDELKEVTGNRDVSTGGTATGVTAASAIAAIQEAGSKLSRDNNRASQRAFRRICLQIIELIRQFYDLPRCFRIVGADGAYRFLSYSNERLRGEARVSAFGVDMGANVPLFDVKVGSEKASPYSRLSQNEMALQFFGAGFFDPRRSAEALACLDIMDFERKQSVIARVERIREAYLSGEEMSSATPKAQVSLKSTSKGEATLVRRARERVAKSTTPT